MVTALSFKKTRAVHLHDVTPLQEHPIPNRRREEPPVLSGGTPPFVWEGIRDRWTPSETGSRFEEESVPCQWVALAWRKSEHDGATS